MILPNAAMLTSIVALHRGIASKINKKGAKKKWQNLR